MQPSPAEYERALRLLLAGELVGLPTETVYGLGADATNPDAVAKIFAAKGRPADHPLIVHLADVAALDDWAAEIPDFARRLAAHFWPGPLTLILKKQAWVPSAVTGGQDSVGLRVPAHPVALALLQQFRTLKNAAPSGIAAPSANRFGRISPTTAGHVRDEFSGALHCILDGGPCQVGIESTIVDCTRGAPLILRPGQITAEAIAQILAQEACGAPRVSGDAGLAVNKEPPHAPPRVSGSLAAHYAPLTPLRQLPPAEIPAFLAARQAAGEKCGVLTYSQAVLPSNFHAHIAMPADSAAYAHDFYAALRQLDALGLHAIIVETLPAETAWKAVADRLQRASAAHLPHPDSTL